MIRLTLVDGHKGAGDILVLLDANHEPLTFAQWLYVGLNYLSSEDNYYPRSQGYAGSQYLMGALMDLVDNGLSLEMVLHKYQLDSKEPLNITDNRKPTVPNGTVERKVLKVENFM